MPYHYGTPLSTQDTLGSPPNGAYALTMLSTYTSGELCAGCVQEL